MTVSSDSHRVLLTEGAYSEKIQRSEFIAHAFPAPSVDVFEERLETLGREHHSAGHLCWAWRIPDEQWRLTEKSSDAGEPSGTAGRPILSAILSRELIASAVVVIRYFGGIRLGTGGLVRAYSAAASGAIDAAGADRIYRRRIISASAPFERMSALYRLVSPPDLVLIDEKFDSSGVRLTFAPKLASAPALEKTLREMTVDYESAPQPFDSETYLDLRQS